MQRPIPSPSDGQRRLRPTRLDTVHSNLREMFTGTSGSRREGSRLERHKSPEITILATRALPSDSSPPNTVLLSPVSPVSPLSPNFLNLSPRSTHPTTPETFSGTSRSPTVPPQVYHLQPQQFWSADSIVQQPEPPVRVRGSRSQRHRGKWKAKSPLLFPGVKEPALRFKLMCCLASGCALALILCLYLGLALSGRKLGQEFHIIFILIILVLTIYFCHSLIRLCMIAMRIGTGQCASRIRSPMGPAHIANPREPIRVVLAHDEEATGLESEATLIPPPAYGNWRYTVRADPNLLHWQRNESHQGEDPQHRPNTANRPPSYISDDGVSYAISATPQTVYSEEHSPLPTHPSEFGRVAWNASPSGSSRYSLHP
ncbi:MAG: hypothetical protein M1840_002521 [Geoglossum simile]|nr:MAG: hypothetical protein M1840_002521 [Geoglossum simile]